MLVFYIYTSVVLSDYVQRYVRVRNYVQNALLFLGVKVLLHDV